MSTAPHEFNPTLSPREIRDARKRFVGDAMIYLGVVQILFAAAGFAFVPMAVQGGVITPGPLLPVLYIAIGATIVMGVLMIVFGGFIRSLKVWATRASLWVVGGWLLLIGVTCAWTTFRALASDERSVDSLLVPGMLATLMLFYGGLLLGLRGARRGTV